MQRMGLGQRVVLVIGLGLALLIGGRAILRALARPGPRAGWVGYAPLSRPPHFLIGMPHPWLPVVVRLVLLAVWIAGALLILRRPAGAAAPPAAVPPGAVAPGAVSPGAGSGPAAGAPS